jgi:uncharacterized protein YkwD
MLSAVPLVVELPSASSERRALVFAALVAALVFLGAYVAVASAGAPSSAIGDATDPNGDGQYEDVNGDGAVTVVDVQALFTRLDESTGESALAFDFNADSSVDITDVQRLFVSIQEGSFESTPTPTATPTPTPTTTADDGNIDDGRDSDLIDDVTVERRIHYYVNQERAALGLGSLQFDGALEDVAQYHSDDMISDDYFAHTAPDGETRQDRYEKFGYDCRVPASNGEYFMTGAENLHQSYYRTRIKTENGTVTYDTPDELARSIVRSWMNSSDHRENIVEPDWNSESIGVAAERDANDNIKVYTTQNFC